MSRVKVDPWQRPFYIWFRILCALSSQGTLQMFFWGVFSNQSYFFTFNETSFYPRRVERGKVYILKGFSRLIVGFDVQWRWISLWDVLLWKLLYQGKLFRYFIFRPWTSFLGWDLLVSLTKSWVFSVTVPKKGNVINETFPLVFLCWITFVSVSAL